MTRIGYNAYMPNTTGVFKKYSRVSVCFKAAVYSLHGFDFLTHEILQDRDEISSFVSLLPFDDHLIHVNSVGEYVRKHNI